jgi:hypothetical protein
MIGNVLFAAPERKSLSPLNKSADRAPAGTAAAFQNQTSAPEALRRQFNEKGTVKKAQSLFFFITRAQDPRASSGFYPFISLTFFVNAGHITFRSATIP